MSQDSGNKSGKLVKRAIKIMKKFKIILTVNIISTLFLYISSYADGFPKLKEKNVETTQQKTKQTIQKECNLQEQQ